MKGGRCQEWGNHRVSGHARKGGRGGAGKKKEGGAQRDPQYIGRGKGGQAGREGKGRKREIPGWRKEPFHQEKKGEPSKNKEEKERYTSGMSLKCFYAGKAPIIRFPTRQEKKRKKCQSQQGSPSDSRAQQTARKGPRKVPQPRENSPP